MSKLTVITGPMFSGKTEYILTRIKRAKYANQTIQIFVPTLDTRNGIGKVISHAGNHLNDLITSIATPADFSKRIRPSTNLLILDEVQFFEDINTLYKEIEILLQRDKLQIYVAGLDRDFTGRPFGAIPYLMALADKVIKLTAICVICGDEANTSFRKVNNDSVVLIGGTNEYEARCRKCHRE